MTKQETTTPSSTNQLISTISTVINNKSIEAIDARELHKFLESKQDFSNWVTTKVLNSTFFQENYDYIVFSNIVKNPLGGRPKKDYALTQETAKKVAMSEQTPRGNEARDYFLEMEKVARQVHTSPKAELGNLTPLLHDAKGVAEFFGLKGNQALLSANTTVKKLHKIDCMDLAGVTHLISEDQVQYLTPTIIGKEINLSAAKVNKAIEAAGFQEETRDHKKRIVWLLTKAGEKYAQLLDTNKKNSLGTPIMQIKWSREIIEHIKPKA